MKWKLLIFLIPVIVLVTSCAQKQTPFESEQRQIRDTTAKGPTLSVPVPPVSSPPPGAAESVDKPSLSGDEVESMIWSRLHSRLPSEFSMEHLSRDKFQLEYTGNNKWNFAVPAFKQTRELLAPEILKNSDVWWTKLVKEQYTDIAANIEGIFYENTYTFDILSSDQYIDNTATNFLSIEEIYATLQLRNTLDIQDWKDYFIYSGSVKNITMIPLSSVCVQLEFTNKYSQTGNYTLNINPDQSETFVIHIPKTEIKHDMVSEYKLKFFTSSGQVIDCFPDTWQWP